jgi:hypothetical protein
MIVLMKNERMPCASVTPAHRRARDLHIRYLRGHAHHEGKVEEVPRSRLFRFRKEQPTRINQLTRWVLGVE